MGKKLSCQNLKDCPVHELLNGSLASSCRHARLKMRRTTSLTNPTDKKRNSVLGHVDLKKS